MLGSMETIEAELIKDGSKRDDRGRRLVAEAERERLIGLYETSGLTQKEFARREGIKDPTFVAWLSRHRKSGSKHDTPVRFEQFLLAGAGASKLEVQLPGGLIVRGSEVDAVVGLVKMLKS